MEEETERARQSGVREGWDGVGEGEGHGEGERERESKSRISKRQPILRLVCLVSE